MQKEKNLENECCAIARRLGIISIKLEKNAHTGIPDRLFLKNGKAVFVEFKAKGGVISENQTFWRQILQGNGFAHYYCDNVADFFNILMQHF